MTELNYAKLLYPVWEIDEDEDSVTGRIERFYVAEYMLSVACGAARERGGGWLSDEDMRLCGLLEQDISTLTRDIIEEDILPTFRDWYENHMDVEVWAAHNDLGTAEFATDNPWEFEVRGMPFSMEADVREALLENGYLDLNNIPVRETGLDNYDRKKAIMKLVDDSHSQARRVILDSDWVHFNHAGTDRKAIEDYLDLVSEEELDKLANEIVAVDGIDEAGISVEYVDMAGLYQMWKDDELGSADESGSYSVDNYGLKLIIDNVLGSDMFKDACHQAWLDSWDGQIEAAAENVQAAIDMCEQALDGDWHERLAAISVALNTYHVTGSMQQHMGVNRNILKRYSDMGSEVTAEEMFAQLKKKSRMERSAGYHRHPEYSEVFV